MLRQSLPELTLSLPKLSQSSSRPSHRLPELCRALGGSGEVRARFDCKNRWFSHNLELVTGAAGAAGAGEVVARPAARTPHPTRAGGQDDGSYTNSLKQGGFYFKEDPQVVS